MSCFVYVIGTNDRGPAKTYVGWTNNLEKRLTAHNSGKGARSTRGRTWRLFYAEKYQNRSDAMRREWHLKRDRKLRQHIKDNSTPDI